MMRRKSDRYDFKLASGSPRRAELLEIVGWNALCHPVAILETAYPDEDPPSFAKRLALEKAKKAVDADSMIVLGADTIVILGDRILGKPLDQAHAARMLEELRGKIHQVITAIALVDHVHDRSLVEICETDVPMRDYSEEELKAYIETGSPLDKAGAYGIQDGDFYPVDLETMDGCFANVMGLPLCHVARAFKKLGLVAPDNLHENCIQHTGYACQAYMEILQREI
jgi:septum formation protein